MITARAPGKIILSGEHAVVYGRPALLLAVNRYATARLSDADRVFIRLGDRESRASEPEDLPAFKQAVDARYAAFLDSGQGLEAVVPEPEDLVRYVIADFFARAGQAPRGLELAIDSGIPMGCGMGSSAAVILSVLRALSELHHADWNADRFYEQALCAENLQHGRSSGADPFACLHGGFVKFRQGSAERLDLSPLPFALVHTGKPASSTGVCVASVARSFGDSAIWDQFEAVARYIETGIRNDQEADIVHGIRKNHELLSAIGVVPARVGDFIHEVERSGGAAKICGAGSIDGDSAGMVLIYGIRNPNGICEQYGYERMNVEVDEHGTRIV